jgi:hypothetical protein
MCATRPWVWATVAALACPLLGVGPATGGGNQDCVVSVNSREALLNVVTKAKREMLSRLDRKARCQFRRLRTPPAQ